jgi:hypothetical protein
MELYRYLIDDFLIEYCRGLKLADYIVKTEHMSRNKQEKRENKNKHNINNVQHIDQHI